MNGYTYGPGSRAPPTADWRKKSKLNKGEVVMGEMSELSCALNEIINSGQELMRQLIEFRDCLIPGLFSIDAAAAVIGNAPPKSSSSEVKEETSEDLYDKEEIRALLAAKASEDGGRFRADVKAIVKKYGNGGCFTDIPSRHYPDIVREVSKLKAA